MRSRRPHPDPIVDCPGGATCTLHCFANYPTRAPTKDPTRDPTNDPIRDPTTAPSSSPTTRLNDEVYGSEQDIAVMIASLDDVPPMPDGM